ncbi:MAG: hypothetical protein U5Q03_00060 [Bacteroidota bacterium]|nr:hypothetical protein [Bacteroidota bacterium]
MFISELGRWYNSSGVDDDGGIQGIDEDALDQQKKDIVSAMNN